MVARTGLLRGLTTVLLAAGTATQAAPFTSPNTLNPRAVDFRDDFTTFDRDVWSCEYTCPVIEGEKARFRLRSGLEPDQEGTWSKASYSDQTFTSGRFSVSFALTARPEGKVWWGVALWDDSRGDDEFNEINFGYTVDGSFSNSELLFESANRGVVPPLQENRIDTGVDLYDEQYHTATLEYDSEHVSFFFDGELMKTITDKQYIPTDPMKFILGPRIVKDGGGPLESGFTQSIDWVEISA